MSEWQPIETAPKNGTRVMVIEFNRTDPIPITATCGVQHGRWHSIPGAYALKPTHWMPLPAPPSLPTPKEP